MQEVKFIELANFPILKGLYDELFKVTKDLMTSLENCLERKVLIEGII